MQYTKIRMRGRRAGEAGFTLVELSVTVFVIGIVVVSFFGLFISLIRSTIIAKREAVAVTLATNQMEYLKSLPYDSLAVQGGSIYATSLLPATKTQTVDGVRFTTTTSIGYVDDAYDGCGSYPTQALKQTYCRNYPPPSGAPATDLNPADYKIIHVGVTDNTGANLSSEDTEVSARVSETASTTGALFVTVTDASGNPVSGATVNVTDSTVTPAVNVSDSTDSNGVAIFYDLPPDTGTDYVISASESNYSSLTTIAASGSLQPTYASQKILSQQSSSVTLVIAPQGANSLLVQTTDVSGNPLTGVKVYAKGGYKKYTSATDYSYYYDNYYSNYNSGTVSDSRPTTDASGYTTLSNLAPVGNYLFCNSDAASAGSSTTNCAVGATKYYLAAAVPYGGDNSLMPIEVPTYSAASPPTTTFSYGGSNYLQEVQLLLTTSSSFPRVYGMNPYDLSLATASNLASFPIVITGYNLSSASVKLTMGGTTYSGTGCAGTATKLTCNFDLTGIVVGTAQLSVTNGSGTLNLPYSPQLGGFNVTP
jgi:prepilin-type N-terminal cleavage/methylation domain-containing protein